MSSLLGHIVTDDNSLNNSSQVKQRTRFANQVIHLTRHPFEKISGIKVSETNDAAKN